MSSLRLLKCWRPHFGLIIICLAAMPYDADLRAQDSALPQVTIYFTVKNGKLAIDETRTTAQPNFMKPFADLAQLGSGWTPEYVKTAYFAQINDTLAQENPFVYWFFQVDFTKQLADVKSVAAPLAKITASSWDDYKTQYNLWRTSFIGKPWPSTGVIIKPEEILPLPPVAPPPTAPGIDSNQFQVHYAMPNGADNGEIYAFHNVLNRLFAPTALHSVWGEMKGNLWEARTRFQNEGSLVFYVLPAPTAANMQINILDVTAGTDEGAIVDAANRYLVGQRPMWLYPQKLSARLETFFQFHGLDFTMTDTVHLPRQGIITRVAALSFNDSVSDTDKRKFANYFLSHREAEVLDSLSLADLGAKGVYHMKVSSSKDAQGNVSPEKYAYFDLLSLRKIVYGERSLKASYPAYHPNLTVDASYSLAQIGYETTISRDDQSAPTQPLVDIIFVQKQKPASSLPAASGGTKALASTGTSPPQGGSAPGPDTVSGTNARQSPSIPPPRAKTTVAAKSAPAPSPSEKQIGLAGSVGVTYLPDQGVKTVAHLQQDLTAIHGGTLTANAGYFKEVFGSLGYSCPTDLLGTGGIFSTQGYSNVDPRRILYSQDIDERITGGEADISVPWGFDNADQSLDVALKGTWRNIGLSSAVPLGSSSYNVASMDGKASYNWAYDPLEPASCFYASMEAQGYAECSPATVLYSREDLRAGVRRYFTDLLTYEGDVYLGTSSGATPAFDEISVGSADTVRTLRADYELGRAAWSLQNEIWLPVPGMNSDSSSEQGLYSTLYRQCRLSAFADVGRAWDNINTDHGTVIVPGLGFRFQVSDKIVFKADVGYGFGISGRPAGAGTSIGLSTGYNF